MRLRRTRFSDARAVPPSLCFERCHGAEGQATRRRSPKGPIRRGQTERRRRKAAGTGFARSPRDEEKRTAAAQRNPLAAERTAVAKSRGGRGLRGRQAGPSRPYGFRAPEASLRRRKNGGGAHPTERQIAGIRQKGPPGPVPRKQEGPRRRLAATRTSLAYGSPGIHPKLWRIADLSDGAPARRGSVHKR